MLSEQVDYGAVGRFVRQWSGCDRFRDQLKQVRSCDVFCNGVRDCVIRMLRDIPATPYKLVPNYRGGVYSFWNEADDPVYVGRACELKRRIRSHRSYFACQARYNPAWKIRLLYVGYVSPSWDCRCEIGIDDYEAMYIALLRPVFNSQKKPGWFPGM